MLAISIFLAIVLLIIYVAVRYCIDKEWQRRPMRNFSFIHHGQEFWYSRSVACTLFCFNKDSNGDWCVLANKRGDGTPDFQGLWNVVCGYLDFDETGAECAQRETFEETSFFVPLEKINQWGVSTNPEQNRQNVSIRYYAIMDDNSASTSRLSNENSEAGEVFEAKWIPLKDISSYEWAFDHDKLINEFISLNLLN